VSKVSAIQAKKALKYVMLPGIVPRAKALLGSGFAYLAFLMAQIYGIVRLLPRNHAYLNPQNIGRYGLKHVVAEAANHLVINHKNIDQIFIFFALMAGLVILALQFLFLIYATAIAPALAFAQTSIFVTGAPEQDIAFMMLDRVFGIPGLYDSCVAGGTCANETSNGTIPWPIHHALHGLLEFYSYGLLIIALVIILYFILVVITETAATGSPFGQRFQNVWVPVRLVMAIGLLVPINHGLNSSQYIVLYAAKLGSSFATNGWLTYNRAVRDQSNNITGINPTGEVETLVGYPSPPDISPVFKFMTLVHTCGYMEWLETTGGDLSKKEKAHLASDSEVRPYFVKNIFPWQENQEERLELTPGVGYEEALDFYNGGDITIVFGEHQEDAQATGNVAPTCGAIRIPVTNLRDRGRGEEVGGPDKILSIYYELVKTLWFGKPSGDFSKTENQPLFQFAARYAGVHYIQSRNEKEEIACGIGCDNEHLPSCEDPAIPLEYACLISDPDRAWEEDATVSYNAEFQHALTNAYKTYLEHLSDLEIEPEILAHGWGGAGMWYNRIAELNGAYLVSTQAVPTEQKLPKTMEDVRALKRRTDEDFDPRDQFNPNFANAVTLSAQEISEDKARTLHAVYTYWDPSQDGDSELLGNVFEDTVSLIFGLDALFQIRGDNASIHPMAQLTLIGKGMVESTIRNIAGSSALGFAGGLTSALGNQGAGSIMSAMGGFVFSTAFIGLTAGLVLFYVLPFMPFVYFFFAVASWVKGLFEAMVGAPLWALAHIRLDGEGLPGEAAENGYFLILDIIIRPIIIVFGLIAATLIFGAQVRILNVIWDLVVVNITGFSEHQAAIDIAGMEFKRDKFDQFFFTIIYTIIVYMLANASFKLIDMIPKDIMRWMGSGVTTFGDMSEGPAENLSQYVAMGGMVQGQQIAGAINTGSSEMGGVVGNALKADRPT